MRLTDNELKRSMRNEIMKTDQELVAGALADRHAFSEIVHRYESPIRRYVQRLGCTNGDDIDDVLQEVFIKVFMNMNDYDADLKFSSWIYRIAHNETISFFRKKNAHSHVLRLDAQDADVFFENLADDKDFTDGIHRKDDSSFIRTMLDGIDKKYKEALMLRFLEEKNYTEISDILKVPEGTVATLISRGKKELKTRLKDHGEEHI